MTDKPQTTSHKSARGYAASASIAVALALLVNWLADALKGEVPFCAWTGLEPVQCRAAGGAWIAVVAICAALAAVAALGTRLMSRLRAVDELVETDLRPADVLLTLVSRPAGAHALAPESGQLPMPPNWEPIAQAVRAYAPTLQRLVLVGSRQSRPFLGQCTALLQASFPDRCPVILQARHCPDYFCLADVRDTLSREIAALQQDAALRGAHLVVDITGGTKTASIAAAIAAMERDVALQYVEGAAVRTYRIGAERWQAW